MAYEMMYFQKEATSQILSPQISFSMDIYAQYADSFDLSLLKNNTDVNSTSTSRKNQNSSNVVVASQMSPEYIPATIFPDSMQSLKKSLAWNMSSSQTTVNSEHPQQQQQQDCVAMEEDPPMFSAQNIHNYKTNFYSCPLPSPPQETTVSSSTSSIASPPAYTQHIFHSHMNIKQEHIILPPSPPESDAAFESDADVVKNEPTDTNNATTEQPPPTCIDIEYFLKSSFDSMNQSTSNSNNDSISDNNSDKKQQQQQQIQQQDHQLLRECLQDTSFQKKHNLRPVALESLFSGCGWNIRGDIEPVISLALEQAKCDIKATCAALDISPDPKEWTTEQAHLWLRSTIQQFKLPPIPNMEKTFPENGQELSQLSEDEFIERCPQAGSTLHGQLEVWIAACPDVSYTPTTIDGLSESMSTVENPSDICMTTVIKSEIDETSIASPLSTVSCSNISTTVTPSLTTTAATSTPASTSSATPTTTPATKTSTTRQGSAHIHLWQFLKELLSAPQTYGTALRWIDRKQGIFKIEDSVRVARLWGRRKNRPAMNYDKLSRSIRQYYKKGIMKKTERSQRLVYQFCHPYFL